MEITKELIKIFADWTKLKFNKDILWALPITSKDKTGKYYYQFEHNGNKNSVILSQIRLISSRRLLRRVGVFPNKNFDEIREKLKNMV